MFFFLIPAIVVDFWYVWDDIFWTGIVATKQRYTNCVSTIKYKTTLFTLTSLFSIYDLFKKCDSCFVCKVRN
jgi:hypothetical protein